MARSIRTKSCNRCQQLASVLYRIQWDDTEQWIFACDRCLPELKQNNPFYVYGGTWKAKKKR
jgi:hypothetical protein